MKGVSRFWYEFDSDQVRNICKSYCWFCSSDRLVDTQMILWPLVKKLYIDEMTKANNITEDDLQNYRLSITVYSMYEQDFMIALRNMLKIHTIHPIYMRYEIAYADSDLYHTFKNKMKLKGVSIEQLPSYEGS